VAVPQRSILVIISFARVPAQFAMQYGRSYSFGHGTVFPWGCKPNSCGILSRCRRSQNSIFSAAQTSRRRAHQQRAIQVSMDSHENDYTNTGDDSNLQHTRLIGRGSSGFVHEVGQKICCR